MNTAIQSDSAAKQQTEDYLKAILVRSTKDADFRRQLLSDSASALAAFSGVSADKLPAGRINFVQHENAPTIVLPKFGQDLEELSDNQLETVSGGTEPLTLFAFGVIYGVEAGIIIYELAKASKS